MADDKTPADDNPYTQTHVVQSGDSRSFPPGDAFLAAASADGEVVIHLGSPLVRDDARAAILVELGTDCLGVHTGEQSGDEGSNAPRGHERAERTAADGDKQ